MPRTARRSLLKLAPAAALLSLPGGAARAQRRGGTLVFAQEAAPPTLDMHNSTSIASRNIAMHVFECLVTRDERNAPVAELAEGWEISGDGLAYAFRIREGLRFHNGKELTSADVLASWRRYQRVGLQRQNLAPVAAMEAADPRTFVVRLRQRQPVFLDTISSFLTPIVIFPAEEEAKEAGRAELIGTGPYRFVEWVPDSHVLLRRFDEYRPDERSPGNNGFAGRKIALADQLRFRFVPEAGARVAGLEAREFQLVEDVPTRAATRLRNNRALQMHPLRHWWLHGAWVNHAHGPTASLPVRRAIQAALDMEEIMEIATDGAYELHPGLQYPGNPYFTDAGKELYNQKNPDLARRLLREANYQNEELVIITNSSFASMQSAAVVVTEQLRAVGMRVRMDVFDWATAIGRRRERTAWSLWFTGQGTGPAVGPFSALADVVTPQLNQFTPDPVLDGIYQEMLTGETEEARKAAFARFQQRVYENVLFLKFGDLTKIQAARATVRGYVPYRIPRLWNVWNEA